MIPIPLWLTPQVMKAGIVGGALLLIFFAGFYVKGKLDDSKILRMQQKVQKIEYNYGLCLADVEQSVENYEVLATAIENANKEIEKQSQEYKARVVQLREMNRAAISQLNALHDASMSSMNVEADELRERFAQMSASEACHSAMLEIVK